MRDAVLLACALFLATGLVTIPAHATDLTGEYTAAGHSPKSGKAYTATAKIMKKGDVYEVTWNVDGKGYLGTGILIDDVLAVAYTDDAKTWFGIIAYKIESDGAVLVGQWTGGGATVVGDETLTRQ